MTKKKTTEEYESPQAIHLTDKDRAFGQCTDGSTELGEHGYRVYGSDGVCVTGKDANGGCYAGIGGCTQGSDVFQ